MEDKTRIKHRYLQDFCKWHQRHLCAINMNCDTRRRNHVHFFGKAKILGENKMKKTSEQDTCFVPRQILIWKWAKPSESDLQSKLSNRFWPPCPKCTACAKCSELGVQIRGWCTFSRQRLTGEFCLRIRIRWRSMDRCTFSRVLIFAGTPAKNRPLFLLTPWPSAQDASPCVCQTVNVLHKLLHELLCWLEVEYEVKFLFHLFVLALRPSALSLPVSSGVDLCFVSLFSLWSFDWKSSCEIEPWTLLIWRWSVCDSINWLKAGPPLDLSFWSFLTFLHHVIEKVEGHLLWKFYKKIRRKSWSNVPPKLVACIGFLYKGVHKIGRLRKFNRSREIEFNFLTAWTIFMKFGTLVQHAPGYKTLPQNF